MNFFEHQERARKKTGTLIFLFALAIIGIAFFVYLSVIFVLHLTGAQEGMRGSQPAVFEWWQPDMLMLVTAGVLTVVLAGTIYKVTVLQEGGAAVARMLGGRLIIPETTGPDERKVLNVVEEMSIASGVPVPPVYLLPAEPGINAFAAGFSQTDAVIGVTDGAMKLLTRDELQGVIAHEFSHILNGDMAINLRLIGVLNGIFVLAVAGQSVLRLRMTGGRRGKDGGGAVAAILFIGLALWIIGYIGVFFGRLIKSAVSREREHLADASGVQFTRNPAGLAGALKKIGGLVYHSYLETPKAEEASHLFFSEALHFQFSALFATHPPLAKRIRLLDPAFDGKFPDVKLDGPILPPRMEEPNVKPAAPGRERRTALSKEASPLSVSALVGTLSEANLQYAAALIDRLPEKLTECARDPVGSRALLFALLMDHKNEAVEEAQLRYLLMNTNNFVYQQLRKIYKLVGSCPREMYLPLLDLALPALSLMPAKHYEVVRKNIDDLINQDLRLDLFEMVLRQIVVHYLDARLGRKRPQQMKYHSPQDVKKQAEMLLTALAHEGASTEETAAAAFETAAAFFETGGDKLSMVVGPPSPKDLEMHLSSLSFAAPLVKEKFLKAAAAAVQCDKKVSMNEMELLRAFSSALDCPFPLLDYSASSA